MGSIYEKVRSKKIAKNQLFDDLYCNRVTRCLPRRHYVCAIQEACGLVHTGHCSNEWKKTEPLYIVLIKLSLRVITFALLCWRLTMDHI